MKLRNSIYLTHKGTSASVLPIKVPIHLQYFSDKAVLHRNHWRALLPLYVRRKNCQYFQWSADKSGRRVVVANLTNKEMARARVGHF